MSKHVREIKRGQKGFTLIELVAVMAILVILVAIVAPAAINTERASISAQAQADSQQVRNAANDFFTRHTESEVRTPHTVILLTAINVTSNTVPLSTSGQQLGQVTQRQMVSSRWPEVYITEGTGVPPLSNRSANSKYSHVFPAVGTPGPVVNVTLKDRDGHEISGNALLGQYTAIDLDKLVETGLLNKLPDGEGQTSATGVSGLDAPNFLWLFKEQSSSIGTGDDRAVAVFILVKVVQIEAGPAAQYVRLIYQQILGPGPDVAPAVFVPPTIDGVLGPNEWGTPVFTQTYTTATGFGYEGGVNIYILNNATNLYVAAQATDPTHSTWGSVAQTLGLATALNIYIDSLADGVLGANDLHVASLGIMGYTPGAEYMHAAGGGWDYGTIASFPLVGAIAADGDDWTGNGIVEVRIPLSLLSMQPGDRLGIAFQAFSYSVFPSWTVADWLVYSLQ